MKFYIADCSAETDDGQLDVRVKVISQCYVNERNINMDHTHHKPNMPIQVDLEKDKTYYWCTCGKTSDRPFCDQSHEGTEFTPLEFTVERDKKAFLCSCRKTKNAPYCDSSHEGDHAYIMSELVR